MNKELRKIIFVTIVLAALLCLSILQSLGIGVVEISWRDILKLFYYSCFGAENAADEQLLSSSAWNVIFDLRLPRIIMAVICGGSLALGGLVMQALIRNPLADPYILGVSAGAAMGAAISIVLGAFSFLGIYGVSAGAFVGAVAVAFAVFALTASSGGQSSMTRLVLTGMALNAVCGASTSMLVYLAKDVDGIRDVQFWIMGSLARANWETIPLCAVIFFSCCLYFLYQFRVLNASLLGDEMAIILGETLERKRKIYLVLVSVMVSSVVASVGIIGFVGLVIPHVARIFFGNNHIWLVPVSVFSGALYMIWCDVFARTVLTGMELPIGVLTSFIGGPLFLYLMSGRQFRYGE